MDSTIFMNISTDEVILSNGNDISISLTRNDIETTLGKELVNIVRKYDLKNILVLNGPGGFTNLRVGTLCLNVLNTLLTNQIDIFSISKTSLYYQANKKGVLPKYGIIYIGQKRNIRLRDFEKNTKIGQYSFDELQNIDLLQTKSDIFLDEVFDDKYYPERLNSYIKARVSFNGNNLIVNDKELSIESLGLSPIKSVAPDYMMEPSITLK